MRVVPSWSKTVGSITSVDGDAGISGPGVVPSTVDLRRHGHGGGQRRRHGFVMDQTKLHLSDAVQPGGGDLGLVRVLDNDPVGIQAVGAAARGDVERDRQADRLWERPK